ncbi:tetratricopeptide repeat protein [Chryseobacterium turcicum]|uniref:Tetratricopeptide repeat protein n=1 Tax=Chryseobacterium turcicum TaxID=2898076 RepID=A0A9Q3V6D4_9FLAO|nr:tetratricopeptide repeat protein [Chryseobacterium turcicum]MCD1118190.1 tetratricopeptide repeat protein [Chryseobacterium turcicum]
MKNLIQSFFLIWFGALHSQQLGNFIPTNYEISLKKECDFNSDKQKDYILILSNKKENERPLISTDNNISKRMLLILKKNNNNKYEKVFESNEIVPCRECSGKSDNLYSDISFNNYILKFSTTNYPFDGNRYFTSTYSLKYEDNKFYLEKYEEKFYENAEDDNPLKVNLSNSDFEKRPFDFYLFNFGNNTWENQIIVNNKNVAYLNNIAFYYLQKNQNNIAEILLEKILQNFPERVVAWLNLADLQWKLEEREKAKTFYEKYISLMKSQGKDLNKIPLRVYERIK